MERLSRLVILVSILSAGVAHAFLINRLVPTLPWIAGGVFVASYALTRLSLRVALLPALLLAYASPAALFLLVGEAGARDSLAWLSLLAGPIVASSDWSRWHTPRLWTPLLVTWAVTVALTWPIIAGREIDFNLIAATTLDTFNGVIGPSPPVAAAMITGTALNLLLAIAWLDLLWQRVGGQELPKMERWILIPLASSIVVTALAGVYQRYVDPNWFPFWLWPDLGRSASLMLDANSFGMAAAIWTPVPLVLAHRMGLSRLAGAFVSAVLLAGAWSSGSRTAFVVAIAGVVGCFAASFGEHRTWRRRLVVVLVLLGTAAAIAIATPRAAGVSPLQRLIGTLPTSGDRSVGRVLQMLWERDGYGVAAARAIADHPIAGVGIGSFNHLAGDYATNPIGAALGPDNAQNWWRQQVAELGLVGAAPSVAFTVLLLVLLVTARAQGDRRGPAIVLRLVLLGVGVISLLGVPTQQPAILFTVVTLIFWLAALVDESPLIAVGRTPARLWALVALVPLIVGGSQLKSAMADLRVPVRAERAGFVHVYGFRGADHANVFWMARRAVAVVWPPEAFVSWTVDGTPLTEPVRVRLWRRQQLIADLQVSRDHPGQRIIAVPRVGQLFSLEAAITGPLPDDRGLKITAEWLAEVPSGTPAELVVR